MPAKKLTKAQEEKIRVECHFMLSNCVLAGKAKKEFMLPKKGLYPDKVHEEFEWVYALLHQADDHMKHAINEWEKKMKERDPAGAALVHDLLSKIYLDAMKKSKSKKKAA